jgi:hypothetical protein
MTVPGLTPAAPTTIDDILLESLSALAAAGHLERACRLAGLACALHRQHNEAAWSRYNVLLHRLARKSGVLV